MPTIGAGAFDALYKGVSSVGNLAISFVDKMNRERNLSETSEAMSKYQQMKSEFMSTINEIDIVNYDDAKASFKNTVNKFMEESFSNDNQRALFQNTYVTPDVGATEQVVDAQMKRIVTDRAWASYHNSMETIYNSGGGAAAEKAAEYQLLTLRQSGLITDTELVQMMQEARQKIQIDTLWAAGGDDPYKVKEYLESDDPYVRSINPVLRMQERLKATQQMSVMENERKFAIAEKDKVNNVLFRKMQTNGMLTIDILDSQQAQEIPALTESNYEDIRGQLLADLEKNNGAYSTRSNASNELYSEILRSHMTNQDMDLVEKEASIWNDIRLSADDQIRAVKELQRWETSPIRTAIQTGVERLVNKLKIQDTGRDAFLESELLRLQTARNQDGTLVFENSGLTPMQAEEMISNQLSKIYYDEYASSDFVKLASESNNRYYAIGQANKAGSSDFQNETPEFGRAVTLNDTETLFKSVDNNGIIGITDLGDFKTDMLTAIAPWKDILSRNLPGITDLIATQIPGFTGENVLTVANEGVDTTTGRGYFTFLSKTPNDAVNGRPGTVPRNKNGEEMRVYMGWDENRGEIMYIEDESNRRIEVLGKPR